MSDAPADGAWTREGGTVRALIATGTGRYGDPWHPYPATSALIAQVLEDAGFDAATDTDVEHAMASLADVDLLVVNAGDPWRGDAAAQESPVASVTGLAAALERGIGVLGLHAAVSSLRDYPCWGPAIGAVWLPGMSWHPPAGRTIVHPTGAHGGPVGDFEAFGVLDERYLRLQRLGTSTVVAEFEHCGVRHPAAWVGTHGRARVTADLLGHDESSYESAGHRDLVRRLARWAVARG